MAEELIRWEEDEVEKVKRCRALRAGQPAKSCHPSPDELIVRVVSGAIRILDRVHLAVEQETEVPVRKL